MVEPSEAATEPRDRLEQAVRLLLLLLLWGMWLSVRALWAAVNEITAAHAKSLLRRALSWGLLAGLVLLAPHAVGLWWSRMMLVDAAREAAARAEGRDLVDVQAELRRKAFQLGFHDLFDQADAILVQREEREAGPVCRIELDFHHRLDLYGWTSPPIRIQATVEAYVLPSGSLPRTTKDLVD